MSLELGIELLRVEHERVLSPVFEQDSFLEDDLLFDLEEGLDWLEDFLFLSMIGRHDFSFSCCCFLAFCCISMNHFLAFTILKSENVADNQVLNYYFES